MYQKGEPRKKPNPKFKANLLSQITFFFTFDLFRKGCKKDIAENDIYEVLPKYKASRVGDELEEKWKNEVETKSKPSIYRLLLRCYGKYYLLLGVFQLGMKIIMIVVLPKVQSKLISFFTHHNDLTKKDAIFYATVMISLNILICTYNHNYRFLVTELGIKMKTAFCSLIYRKVLKFSTSSLSQNGVGKVVTLISKDVVSFENIIIFLNDMWISVIVFMVAGCLMYAKIGVAALFGILLLILVVPLQVYLANLTSILRIKAAAATDDRLQQSQEVLSSIKLIKMQTWENYFSSKILQTRKLEVKHLRQIYFAKAAFVELGSFITTLILYILVFSYTQLGNILTAEIAFFLRECLRALRSPMTISIPLGILRSAELAASVKRIDELLTAEEETKKVVKKSTPTVEFEDAGIVVNSLVLHGINIKIDKGLNLISGRVGSGKSSLLKSILMGSVNRGQIKVNGTVSYAADVPWLFPSSIKQNVLFGRELDEKRYQEVMRLCALDIDCSSFAEGDGTIIDDGGRNLSKGQQVRINLARAVYSNSDIYLIDDFLTSLDVHIQEFVFTECFEKFLKNKIVVLVCNNRRFFGRCECVFLIDCGTVKSLDKSDFVTGASFQEQSVDYVDEDTENVDDETKLLDHTEYKNIYHEDPKKGKVDLNVYQKYFLFGGGFLMLFAILALYAVTQTGLSYTDKAISEWVNTQQKIFELNSINSTNYASLLQKDQHSLNLYTLAIVASIVFLLARTYTHFNFFAKAALKLHSSMVTTVINAVMSFFDVRYFGNILNRFSKDMYVVDEVLPFNIHECLKFLCKLVSIIVLIITVNIYFAIPAAIFVAILFFIRWIYMPTGRSLQRLDSATRSPVIGHLNATLEGLSTIRALGTQEILKNEFDRHQDLYVSTTYMHQSTSRAFAYALDMLSNLFIAAVVIRFLIADKDTQAGTVGLAITQALSLPGLFQWGVRQWAELEANMTSVERVLEFSSAKTERKTSVIDKSLLSGDITYENVSLSYKKSKGNVLKDISFTIKSGEKIGVVGRTGAGKSSLISLLFRLYDYDGTITINNVDINSLSLTLLRSNIAVISQDSSLFKGSIRSNIDPLNLYSDEEIWNVINKTKMKYLIPSLNDEVSEGSSHFSSGQKQIICLIRSLVSKNRIFVLDEATANVDDETEVVIHEIIRKHFSECTVIIVSHKLENVLSSDRVMVIDKGEIVEFDRPKVLIDEKDGVFYKMMVKANLLES